ncbi:nucleotide disphospho-sugar-binding domain-containing protein [Streptomyces sp. Ag109_O5-10]|uniref:nucleotide disphospho-sugar-binding domain-containing protein n=1 Tax=Streptomyces sp. Ag109_O5-10 TaxID=1855349 RepID=UPI0008942B43|nr:L-desosaminyltransferase/glycosyltransferase [Streptomyces sp. Ag109_O5-10]
MVVMPGMPGQARQAARPQAAGAGLALPAGEQGPESVISAVGRLLTEPAFTAAARRPRDEIAAMPSATEVAARPVASTGAQTTREAPARGRPSGAAPTL